MAIALEGCVANGARITHATTYIYCVKSVAISFSTTGFPSIKVDQLLLSRAEYTRLNSPIKITSPSVSRHFRIS